MVLLADFVSMLQFSLILALFLRDKALPSWTTSRKVACLFGIWLGGSMVSSALVKTGAFEVYFGQRLIWSSITQGRTPILKDLIDSFQAVGVTIKAPQA